MRMLMRWKLKVDKDWPKPKVKVSLALSLIGLVGLLSSSAESVIVHRRWQNVQSGIVRVRMWSQYLQTDAQYWPAR